MRHWTEDTLENAAVKWSDPYQCSSKEPMLRHIYKHNFTLIESSLDLDNSDEMLYISTNQQSTKWIYIEEHRQAYRALELKVNIMHHYIYMY